MKEESTINYAFALKHYNQNCLGRSMKKFCEDEGYDYEKFMRYSRRGEKECSVLKEADACQGEGKDRFIPLVAEGAGSGGGIQLWRKGGEGEILGLSQTIDCSMNSIDALFTKPVCDAVFALCGACVKLYNHCIFTFDDEQLVVLGETFG